jgi:hypothetical protein
MSPLLCQLSYTAIVTGWTDVIPPGEGPGKAVALHFHLIKQTCNDGVWPLGLLSLRGLSFLM